jgi:hypothetical protein
MGCFQNGIALSLSQVLQPQPQPHPQPHTRIGARNVNACLQPIYAPAPTGTRPQQRLCPRARSTGEDTAGQPDSRTVGLSARPIADLDPDGQNMLPRPTNQMAPPDDFMSPGRITDSIAYHSARFSVPESAG